MERLDKLLANTGRWSRKEARQMIRAGRVLVGGATVTVPETKTARGETVSVDGETIDCEAHVYLMLNKPAGVLSATEDSRQRTVLDLLPEHLRRVGLFPVGRLDRDTEGLLLLTDDGALAHRLLAPVSHVDKRYFVRVDAPLGAADAAAFAVGMELRGGSRFRPAELALLPDAGEAIVTLREGKYHQIKRMMAARGKCVVYLKRLSMGPIALDEGLAPGEFRPLNGHEKQLLAEFGILNK